LVCEENDNLAQIGVIIEAIPGTVSFAANTLSNVVTITLPPGKYFIFAQLGTLPATDIVSVGVSVPYVSLLKQNKFGNNLGFYYSTSATITLLLHATLNIDAQVTFVSVSDYIQAIKLR